MATPILTLELSADENSIFIYAGGIRTEENSQSPSGMVIHDERALVACIGRQREDLELQIQEYVRDALNSCG